MKKTQTNETIGEPLLLLMAFSFVFGAEIKSLSGNISKTISGNNVFVENSHLLIIPALIYLCIKQKNNFLKYTYLLSILPFIYWSTMVQSLNIRILFYLNLIIIFVIIMSLMKYIHKTFEKYKSLINMKPD